MKNKIAAEARQVTRRQVLASAGALSLAGLGVGEAVAADPGYPSKPIKMINAFAPGSGTDNTGRLIADRLSQRLGQPVVVENKPGANMIIGSEYAAKQPADGYTMLMVTLDNLGINPNLYKNPGYTVKDFDPITLVGMLPLVLMASTGFKYSTLAELKQAYNATKKPFSLGTWGVGSVAHMVGELIRMEAGIGFDFVPFQGAAPATTATLGGHVDLTISSAFTSSSHIKGGRAKAIAIGGSSRNPDLPQVPTFAELGYPRINSVQWHGVAVRAGGQQAIVDRLYKEIHAILNEPESREKVLKTGYAGVDARPPAAFSAFIAEEAQAWARVVKASGVTAER